MFFSTLMIFVYITFRDKEEAQKVGKALLERKAAGCVNIWSSYSMFQEEGSLKGVNEVSMIVKTIDSKIQDVEDIVRELHSYKVPCIAAFSLHRLNREYKDWLMSQVG